MRRALGSLVVVLMLLAAPALAQQTGGETNMEIVKQKIHADKKLLVAQNMGLSEEQGKKFWPVYEQLQKDLGKLNDRKLALIQAYAANYETMTDATAKKQLNELLAIQGDRNRVLKSYVPKFEKVLPAKLVARYFQIENKIDAVVSYELAARIPLAK
jgi:hypothetical protein